MGAFINPDFLFDVQMSTNDELKAKSEKMISRGIPTN